MIAPITLHATCLEQNLVIHCCSCFIHELSCCSLFRQVQQYEPSMSWQTTAASSTTHDAQFDPDERQIRELLKQNFKNFDANGSMDFDKFIRELNNTDRNQSGVLNRQQIEEVIYKVRIPLQRTLIYQILEKHCRASSGLYKSVDFIC
jgi:hypothetical protein